MKNTKNAARNGTPAFVMFDSLDAFRAAGKKSGSKARAKK